MCGIVGYVGSQSAAPILLEGLSKLEYRGYDSAGIAVIDGNKIDVEKAKGRLAVLSEKTNGGESVHGCVGIGHTRWATHGEPSDVNSHPHLSQSGRFAVVHNGIIENYISLKKKQTPFFYSLSKTLLFSATYCSVLPELAEYSFQAYIQTTQNPALPVQKVSFLFQYSQGQVTPLDYHQMKHHFSLFPKNLQASNRRSDIYWQTDSYDRMGETLYDRKINLYSPGLQLFSEYFLK